MPNICLGGSLLLQPAFSFGDDGADDDDDAEAPLEEADVAKASAHQLLDVNTTSNATKYQETIRIIFMNEYSQKETDAALRTLPSASRPLCTLCSIQAEHESEKGKAKQRTEGSLDKLRGGGNIDASHFPLDFPTLATNLVLQKTGKIMHSNHPHLSITYPHI